MALVKETIFDSVTLAETGVSDSWDTSKVDSMTAFVTYESGSGTLALFVQGRPAGADAWVDVPSDRALYNSAAATDLTAAAAKRNIDQGRTSTPETLSAVYDAAPFDEMRFKWIGPGASRVVSAWIAGK